MQSKELKSGTVSRTFVKAVPACVFLFFFLYAIRANCQLSGTYSIDATKPASSTNYRNFASAVNDLTDGTRNDGGIANGKGVNAAVTFEVADGVYNGNFFLGEIPGASEVNTITFTSKSKDSTKVIIQDSLKGTGGNEGVIFIGFIKGVIIDHVTVKDSFWNVSCIALVEASNVTISNCILSSSNNGIYEDGQVMTSNNITVKNNRIDCKTGIYKFFLNTIPHNIYDSNWVIENNIVTPQSQGEALWLFNMKELVVDNNYLHGEAIVQNSINLRSISGNVISSLTDGIFIDTCQNDTFQRRSLIANNVIKARMAGLRIWNGSNIDFYYNSVFQDGFATNPGPAVSLSNKSSSISVINNIIATSDHSQLINIDGRQNLGVMDHNDMYTPSDTFALAHDSAIASFTNWTKFTGMDNNSHNFPPGFNSSNNLKVFNTAILNTGEPLKELQYDILGIARDKNSPTPGAYEIDSQRLHINDTTICKGSCATFTSPVKGRKYLWGNGDTTQVMTYCRKKDTSMSLTVWIGSGSTDSLYTSFNIYVTRTACVWPGDANNDGKADVYDVLNIGVAYGDTGSKRINASYKWIAQNCTDWKDTFRYGVNHKYADCDGSGRIDSLDILPIAYNYGNTHAKTTATAGSPTDPPLYIKFSKDSVLAGDTVTADIYLGSKSINAKNIYGIAFSLSYDDLLVKGKQLSASFNNCWIGNAGKNLISFVHNDSASRIDIAIVRTDHANTTGYGKIGELSIVMQDNIGGKTWINKKVRLVPDGSKMVSSDERLLPVYEIADSVRVYQEVEGVRYSGSDKVKMLIYPNPADQVLYLQSENAVIRKIEITDMLGTQVYTQHNVNAGRISLPLNNFAPGPYILIIHTDNGIIANHIIKN